MSERNIQTDPLPDRHDRRNTGAATVVLWRHAGHLPPPCGYGYTGGLFTYGRSYRS